MRSVSRFGELEPVGLMLVLPFVTEIALLIFVLAHNDEASLYQAVAIRQTSTSSLR